MAKDESKLPKHAERVFQGVLFDVYQWDQTMFDGSTERFEMLRRPDTSAVVASVDGKIMMQIEEQPDSGPFLSTPGGRCNEGESRLECAKRELLEETGYASDEWELLTEIRPHGKIEWTIAVYAARNCRKVQEPHVDAGEKIEPKFLTFEEFLMTPDDPMFRTWELTELILRARLEPQRMADLRKKLGV